MGFGLTDYPEGDKKATSNSFTHSTGSTATTIETIASGGGFLDFIQMRGWVTSGNENVDVTIKVTIDGASERNLVFQTMFGGTTEAAAKGIVLPLNIPFRSSATVKISTSSSVMNAKGRLHRHTN